MCQLLKENLIKNFCNEFNKAISRTTLLHEIIKKWEQIREEWNKYDKSSNTELKLELYTNILVKNKNKKNNAQDYICHFLERTSSVFGSSRPGNSMQYMIYKDSDEKYKNSKGETVNDDTAKEIFRKNVEPIFTELFTLGDIPNCKDFISSLEDQNEDIGKKYNDYSAKQVLRKAVVLQLSSLEPKEEKAENKYPLLHIYQDEMIDKWYREFKNIKESTETTESPENKKVQREYENKSDSYFYKSNYIASEFLRWINENKKANNAVEYFIKDFKAENITADCVLISIISSVLWQWYSKIELSPSNPNIILYGAPGTGKTYAVENFLKVNGVDNEHFLKVQFHPNYTYEDFIDGLRPCGITESGQIKFDLVNGHFKNFCIKAKNALKDYLDKATSESKDKHKLYSDAPKFYFIVDEINRANLSSVFGETLTLLEADYRDNCGSSDDDKRTLISTANSSLTQKLLNSEKSHSGSTSDLKDGCYEIIKNADDDSVQSVQFGIPKNLYFIGMMNDVDKSIDSFDLALRRRFQWIRCTCNYDVIADKLRNLNFSDNCKSSKEDIIEDYISDCKNLNHYISKELNLGDNYEFGQSFFMKIADIFEKKNVSTTTIKNCKNKLFDNFLRPTLNEYIRAFYTSEEEISEKLKEAKGKFNPEKKQ